VKSRAFGWPPLAAAGASPPATPALHLMRRGGPRFSYGSVFLLLAMLINLGMALVYPTPFNSLAACALYGVVYLRLFNTRPVAALFFAPIAFMQFTVLISLVAIEGGAHMKELGAIGNASAASSVYLFVISLFIWTAGVGFSALEKRYPVARVQWLDRGDHEFLLHRVPLLLGCLTILWLLAKGASTGFPLIIGADRFAYRRVAGDAITLNILNLKIVLAAFLGAAAGRRPSAVHRRPFHAVFVLYLLISFLFGDKFFIIIVSSLFYIATQAVFDTNQLKSRVVRGLPYAMLALLVAIVMTVFIYSGQGRLSPEATALRLFDRMASQGQLWFLAYDRSFSWVNFDTHQIALNFKSLVENPAQDFIFEHKLGAFFFVQKYAPSRMYWQFVGNEGFVSPIMAAEAYALEIFGLLGALVVLCALAGLLSLICFLTYRAVASGNPFNALFPSYLFVGIYYVVASGTPALLFGYGYFKAYTAFGLLQYLVSKWTHESTLRQAHSRELT
jgi:Family of unknown function (DUF6418)